VPGAFAGHIIPLLYEKTPYIFALPHPLTLSSLFAVFNTLPAMYNQNKGRTKNPRSARQGISLLGRDSFTFYKYTYF